MKMTLFIHILAGSLGLLSGYIALYSAKGAKLHRKSGMLFVYAMLVMSGCGIAITLSRDVALATNVPAGLLTSYLVITSLTTVKPIPRGERWVNLGAMLLALGVGATSLFFAFEAVANGGRRNGMPAFPFFLFGIIGTLAAMGDLRMIRFGAPQGAIRIARHLWRMTFALFIAAMSFFFGQAKVIPKPIRIMPLLALPVLAVLITLLYWLWRVRLRRSMRGMAAAQPLQA